MGEPKLNDSDPGVGGNGGIGDDRGLSAGGGPRVGAGGLVSTIVEVEVDASVPASVDLSARNNGSVLTSGGGGTLAAWSCPQTWSGIDSSNGFLNCTARAGRDVVSSLSVKGEPSDIRVGAEGPACGVERCGGEGNRLGPAVALLSRRRFGRGTGSW